MRAPNERLTSLTFVTAVARRTDQTLCVGGRARFQVGLCGGHLEAPFCQSARSHFHHAQTFQRGCEALFRVLLRGCETAAGQGSLDYPKVPGNLQG